MYSDLMNKIKDEGYFKEIELKDLHGTHVNSSKKVLDMNAFKIALYAILKKVQPASVSAMLFCKSNKLHLIKTEFYAKNDPQYEYIKKVHEEFRNKGILKKLEGSLNILSDFIINYKLASDLNDFFKIKKRSKIKTIILLEANERELCIMKLENLDHMRPDNAALAPIRVMGKEEFETKFS